MRQAKTNFGRTKCRKEKVSHHHRRHHRRRSRRKIFTLARISVSNQKTFSSISGAKMLNVPTDNKRTTDEERP
jgi:hypothetical protein